MEWHLPSCSCAESSTEIQRFQLSCPRRHDEPLVEAAAYRGQSWRKTTGRDNTEHTLAFGTLNWRHDSHFPDYTSLNHNNITSDISRIQVHTFESKVSPECSLMASFSCSSLRSLILYYPKGSSKRCPVLFADITSQGYTQCSCSLVLIWWYS